MADSMSVEQPKRGLGINDDGNEKETAPLLAAPKKAPKFMQTPTYWILFSAILMLNTGYAMVIPSLWPYFNSRGGTESRLGLITAMFSVGQFTGAIILGRISDRFPKRTKVVLNCALAFSMTGSVIYATAGTEWVLYIARYIWGLGAGCAPVIFATCARSTSTAEDRTRAIGIMNMAGTLGYIIGPALAATLSPIDIHLFYNYTFNEETGPGYFAFLTLGLAMLLITFVAQIKPFTPPPAPVSANPNQKKPSLAELGPVCHLIVSHISINFVLFINLSTSEAISAALTKSNYDWNVAANGLLWLVTSALGLGSYLLLLTFAGKVFDLTILAGCLFFQCLGYVILINFSDFNEVVSAERYIVGNLVAGAAISAAISSNLAALTKIITPATQGTVLGIHNAFGSVARASGPLWGVGIYVGFGPSPLFAVVAAILGIGVLLTTYLWFTELALHEEKRKARQAADPPQRRPASPRVVAGGH